MYTMKARCLHDEGDHSIIETSQERFLNNFKQCMSEYRAGMIKAHSTRSATASAATSARITTSHGILKAADWST